MTTTNTANESSTQKLAAMDAVSASLRADLIAAIEALRSSPLRSQRDFSITLARRHGHKFN